MSNYDRAFGFEPWGPVLRARWYSVVTSCALNYYQGDIVGTETNHYLTPRGYLPGVYYGGNIDGLDNLLGAILSIEDEDGFPVMYITAEEDGDGVIAGMLLIADHPEQQYVAREDYSSGAIDILGDANENADIQSQTLTLGNIATGRSRQMIKSSSINYTAALQLKLFGPHPNDIDLIGDDSPGTSTEEGCRWICKINEHYNNMTGVDGSTSA